MWTKWGNVYVVLVWDQNVLFLCGNMALFESHQSTWSITVCFSFIIQELYTKKCCLQTLYIIHIYIQSVSSIIHIYFENYCKWKFFCYHRVADNSFIKIRKLIPVSTSPLFLGIPYMMNMSRCRYYPDDRLLQLQS